MRRVVDTYLAGVSPEDLRLLDAGTRKAERHLKEMATDLDRVDAKIDAVFAQLHRRRRGARKAV